MGLLFLVGSTYITNIGFKDSDWEQRIEIVNKVVNYLLSDNTLHTIDQFVKSFCIWCNAFGLQFTDNRTLVIVNTCTQLSRLVRNLPEQFTFFGPYFIRQLFPLLASIVLRYHTLDYSSAFEIMSSL